MEKGRRIKYNHELEMKIVRHYFTPKCLPHMWSFEGVDPYRVAD